MQRSANRVDQKGVVRPYRLDAFCRRGPGRRAAGAGRAAPLELSEALKQIGLTPPASGEVAQNPAQRQRPAHVAAHHGNSQRGLERRAVPGLEPHLPVLPPADLAQPGHLRAEWAALALGDEQRQRAANQKPLAGLEQRGRYLVGLPDRSIQAGDEVALGSVLEQLAVALSLLLQLRPHIQHLFILAAQLLLGGHQLLVRGLELLKGLRQRLLRLRVAGGAVEHVHAPAHRLNLLCKVVCVHITPPTIPFRA